MSAGHPFNLEEGKEYAVVTRGTFEGVFVGIEGEPGNRVIIFETGGRGVQGKPTQRRLAFNNYVTAVPTASQKAKDGG